MNIDIPRVRNVDLHITAPPSKSYTHRALIAGALASGETRIRQPLAADDTLLTAQALRQMGVPVAWDEDGIRISGCNGSPPCRENLSLNLENSGTSLRLLTSLSLLCPGAVEISGNRRMRERPIGPLVAALNALGGEVVFLERDGYPPIRVSGRLLGGTTTIDGRVSSQFISSVLLASPYAGTDVELTLTELPASRSYIDITADVMDSFGAVLLRDGYSRFRVKSGIPYSGLEYTVEGDYSSASYAFAIAAICGGSAVVGNLNPKSVQGDLQFLAALAEMGCRVTATPGGMLVERTGDLAGITIDMSSSPDTVQTLCMVAAVARSPTTITGIRHLRYKESDRIRVTAAHLQRLGAGVSVGDDSLTIKPAPLLGGMIDPADDHRTAMSFTVLGLGIGGMTIENADCVNKSYPGFWEMLRGAGLL
jgi:3-phosphoshikimate 1-carboxyvinyltransferase